MKSGFCEVVGMVGGGNAEQVELTQPVTIGETECNNVQDDSGFPCSAPSKVLRYTGDTLYGIADEDWSPQEDDAQGGSEVELV